jgi:hypothetical protein
MKLGRSVDGRGFFTRRKPHTWLHLAWKVERTDHACRFLSHPSPSPLGSARKPEQPDLRSGPEALLRGRIGVRTP